MKKQLVVIENSKGLKEAYYTNKFIESWEQKHKGVVIVLDSFLSRTKEEIVAAISQCTDIVVQTSLVNGSESQLVNMAVLLANFKSPINIHIKYLSGRENLKQIVTELLTEKEILNISQHKIFDIKEWDRNNQGELDITEEELDFTDSLTAYYKQRARKAVASLCLEHSKLSCRNKTTGRKVKILTCTAFAKAFENLPIGEVVDEIVADKLVKGTPRGVWIWGNGEPIMLVNDSYPKEYEIVTKLTQEQLIKEICLQVGLPFEKLTYLQHEEMKKIINEDDIVETKANSICELLVVEKRRNRALIKELLTQHS